MIHLLAYAGRADSIISALLVLAVLGLLTYAILTGPDLEPRAPMIRADRDPRSHVRDPSPVPYDWTREDELDS